MQLAFQCPHCRQAVAVASSTARQKMACPLCKGAFWVEPALSGSDPGLENRHAAIAAPPITAPPVIAPRKTQPVVAPPLLPVPPKKEAIAPPAPIRSVARFIATQSVASTVKLTADGKLPELSLTESELKSKDQGSQGTNPVLVTGAIAVSLLSSLLLLFVDFEPGVSSGERERDARRQIQRYLANETDANATAVVLPYQANLRESQRAYSRGDRQAERQNYRRVLELLRSESKNRYSGVTGTPSGDLELEKLLSTLLSSNPG